MKRLAITSIYAVMSIFLFAACNNDDDDATNGGTSQTTNVYVAGYTGNGNNTTAVLWDNGQATTFPDYTSVTDIAVSGNDVYALGSKLYSYNQSYYWKTEQPQTPTLLDGGHGNAIAVLGNDVYVGGFETGSGSPIYWKNGEKIALPTDHSASLGGASSIAVFGSAIYIAGSLDDEAVYWGNGQKVVLEEIDNHNYFSDDSYSYTDNSYSDARGIAVSSNDVYVCGYQGYIFSSYPSTPLEYDVAVYWKNGKQITLAPNAIANGIAVSGNDVYVCGTLSPDGRSGQGEAVYWKNGSKITLAQNAEAKGIAVHGNDVYVCGYINAGSGTLTAVYWKNGQQVEFGTGVANAIAVK